MQCEQLQQRLNELLDRRHDIRSDAELVAHARVCGGCDRLVRAYESMLLGIDLVGGRELEDHFVRRTVDTADRRRRRTTLGRRILGIAATAAAVLIAVGAASWWRPERSSSDDERTVADGGAQPGGSSSAEPHSDASPEAVAKVLHATGRNWAELPYTVLRVAAHPKTDQIVGPMRPLAEPFGATWEVLLRACSGGPAPAAVIPEADTGYVDRQQMQHA